MKRKFLLAISIMVLALVLSGCSSSLIITETDNGEPLTEKQAQETLDALLTRVKVQTLSPRLDISGTTLTDPADELPEITNYPQSVTGRGEIDVEIVASTEKAGTNMDGWLNLVAENFNKSGFELNGQKVSVSIRPIASGLATEYIATGKYIPEAFSPTNQLWAKMIQAKNIDCQLVEEKLVGNTAGILMSKKTYTNFQEKWGLI